MNKVYCQHVIGVWAAPLVNRLIGLVVKVSASRVVDPGFNSCLRWDFLGIKSCH